MGKIPNQRDVHEAGARRSFSEFGNEGHAVIPPFFAPMRWSREIGRFLARNPFDRNVFCMTRYPTENAADPIGEVIALARPALNSHGLTLHLASDGSMHDDLWSNVAGYLWACRYGLALLENRIDKGLNYNLVIEVGARWPLGVVAPC